MHLGGQPAIDGSQRVLWWFDEKGNDWKSSRGSPSSSIVLMVLSLVFRVVVLQVLSNVFNVLYFVFCVFSLK